MTRMRELGVQLRAAAANDEIGTTSELHSYATGHLIALARELGTEIPADPSKGAAVVAIMRHLRAEREAREAGTATGVGAQALPQPRG
jgi:hypothetical protein